MKIGKYLEIRDFLRLGQTKRKLNEVMSRGLSDYTTSIRGPKILTAEIIAVLSKIRNLDLRVSYATEENMRFIGQLTNLQTQLSGNKHSMRECKMMFFLHFTVHH